MENTLPLAPMASGLFGYFGYDMIRHVEAIPANNPDVLSHYDSVFIRPSIVAIFDRLEDTITLATQIRYDANKLPKMAGKMHRCALQPLSAN